MPKVLIADPIAPEGVEILKQAAEVDLRLGAEHSTQTVLTGTYRLTGTQTVSGRLIRQTGRDGSGTNLYFAFGQRVRAGTDLYVLVGDPNSPRTRGEVTVKMIRPF